jgi:hypothetical protein
MTPLATSQAHQLSMSSLELDFPGESAYMIPAKNLGGGGGVVKGKFWGGGQHFSRNFVKILRVGQTNPKNAIFWQNFPIFGSKKFRFGGGGIGLINFLGGELLLQLILICAPCLYPESDAPPTKINYL